MYLGIVPSHDGLHHDPSACIVGGGKIIAFIEEERISRNKHAEGEFPINAIEECLRIASVELDDIDEIGLSRNYNNRRKGLSRSAIAPFRQYQPWGETVGYSDPSDQTDCDDDQRVASVAGDKGSLRPFLSRRG